jgi:hypothetical protein
MTPRTAVFAAFIGFGIAAGLWSGSVAAVSGRAGIGAATLGSATTALIVSGIAGLAAAGRIARVVPLRTILHGAVILTPLATAIVRQAAAPHAFFALLCHMGLITGLCDGSMNAEGTRVERDLGRPVFSGFHTAASLMMGVSAPLGSYLSAIIGTGATALVALSAGAVAASVIARACPRRPIEPDAPHSDGGRARAGMHLPLLGLIAGISITGEVSVLLFAAPMIGALAPDLAAWAGLGVAAYAITQGLVRCFADGVRRRLDDPTLILTGLVTAAFGFTLVAANGPVALTALGFAAVGLGTAPVVPCAFALAPRFSGLSAAQAIGVVSLVTALPRVPMPAGFGRIAEHHGYPAACGLIAALMRAGVAPVLVLRRRLAAPP